MLVSISKPESKYHITWFFPFISGKQCSIQSSYTRCQNIANSLIVYLSWSYWCSWGLFNLQCHSNFCWKISWRKYFQLFSNSQVSSVCPPPWSEHLKKEKIMIGSRKHFYLHQTVKLWWKLFACLQVWRNKPTVNHDNQIIYIYIYVLKILFWNLASFQWSSDSLFILCGSFKRGLVQVIKQFHDHFETWELSATKQWFKPIFRQWNIWTKSINYDTASMNYPRKFVSLW